MTAPPPPTRDLAQAIGHAFIAACDAELQALKPGNVHRYAEGHRMSVADFERAARAAAPHIAGSGLKPGARVLKAVRASLATSRTNTNLGICLLSAPLAKACEDAGATGTRLRASLSGVLANLDREDAGAAFEAIRLANPAGLGRVPKEDVAAPPTGTLREAMALAAPFDRIARAYVTDFEDILAFALPVYRAALCDADAVAGSPELAVTTLHMTLLARFADSHIARKHGFDAAIAVQSEAQGLAALFEPVASTRSLSRLLAFDANLKERGLNPGTTADFVVATLFAARLEAILDPGFAA